MIKVDYSQVERVSLVLTEAFDDNPVIMYLFEDANIRRKILPKIFKIVVNSMMIIGDVYATSDNFEGVIGLVNPNKGISRSNLSFLLFKNIFTSLPLLRYVLNKKSISRIRSVKFKGYPKKYENYFSIEMVAVDKKYRGQGFMSKMVRFCLEEVDRNNSFCLLQTETKYNLIRYEHLGFKLIEKSMVTDSGVYNYILLYDPLSTCDKPD